MDYLAFDLGEALFGGSHFLRSETGVGTLVSSILFNAVVVAGVLLLFLLIFGGFSIMMGAGEQNPQKVAQGQQAATAALVGFVIIFTAYWIMQILGIITGLRGTGGLPF